MFVYLDYDQLLAELSGTPDPYWIARIHCDYAHRLDAYILFSHDPEAVHQYALDLPIVVVDPDGEATAFYLRPESWYFATAKTWIRRLPISEYNAMVTTEAALDDYDRREPVRHGGA